MEVKFHMLLISTLGEGEWYPLDRNLSRSHNHSGRGGKEKNLATTGNRIQLVQTVASHFTD